MNILSMDVLNCFGQMYRNTLYQVVVLIFICNRTAVLCLDDTDDCNKCTPSTNDFLMGQSAGETLSTGQMTRRCWRLRIHYIMHCNMCLRRCISSDLQHHNPICASTESFWPRFQLGRRIFYNECAFLKYVCDVQKPSLWLPWKCMWRHPLDHADCDTSSKFYDNGRRKRKPGLWKEKYPPVIKSDRFKHLPPLSPCPSDPTTTSTTATPTTPTYKDNLTTPNVIEQTTPQFTTQNEIEQTTPDYTTPNDIEQTTPQFTTQNEIEQTTPDYTTPNDIEETTTQITLSTKSQMDSCSCNMNNNTMSICNNIPKKTVIQSSCSGRIISPSDSNQQIPSCRCKLAPPKFPSCSFPKPE